MCRRGKEKTERKDGQDAVRKFVTIPLSFLFSLVKSGDSAVLCTLALPRNRGNFLTKQGSMVGRLTLRNK